MLPSAPGLHKVRTGLSLPAGPTLLVSTSVHGDDYEDVHTVLETSVALDPTALCGSLFAVPIVSRTHPINGGNLDRAFPGRPDGSPSERFAWVLADFYLDLHSGAVRFAMPSMVGAPIIWSHPVIEPGLTISVARARGVPFLYTEARAAGRIHPDDLLMMRRGILNLLRHLNMLAGPPEIPAPSLRLQGIGNTDEGIVATSDGFWMPSVNLLATPQAPADGVVALRRELPPVSVGDTLILLAAEEKI